MRKTILFGQKFSVLGVGSGGGSLPPKIINVPADYPTLIEANTNMGRHYYIGGDPSVTDNDPTKTNTGQTFLLGQDIMWDGISAYFKVGDNAIWSDNGNSVKTVNPRNIDMQGKGLKNINLWTTVGTADADYTLIQAAIDAGKVNLLIIGDYTNSETVVTGANRVTIVIAKKWTMNEGYITIGAGGLDIWGNGSELHGVYTLVANKMFLGSGALRLDGIRVDTSASTTANTGISDLTTGTKHTINNCTFTLSNTGFCGFKNPRDNSLFTNLTVIGGGSSCAGFITEADKIIIDNINISGTVSTGGGFITSANGADNEFVLSNLLSNTTGDLLIRLQNDGGEFSNIHGKIKMQLNDFSYGNFSNINIENFAFNTGNCDNNRFVNFRVNGSDLILIINHDSNTFVNCWFNPGITLAASNNNQFLLCTVVGAYTDSGTNNSFIEGISGDETLSADSRRLLCEQKAIKTYADNIAKGITVEYFFSDTAEGVIPNYDLMYPSDTGQIESSVGAVITAPDTLIASWITETTQPNFTTLLAGIYAIHIHAAKTAGTKDVHIYYKFYKRTHPGGVETLLATSDNSGNLTGSNVGYTLHETLPDDEILADTDRLVTKAYGTPSGAGTDPTATLYLEGTNASRIDIHTTTSSWMLNLQNIIYRNGAGNDSNDGKNMGTPKLTLASAITAAIAQSPSASNMITIKDLGGARLDEDITLPSWCILDTCDAHVIGQVTLGVTMAADSHFYFNKASPESGSECIRISGTGTRYIRGNSTGAALNSTFIVAGGGAVVYLDVVNANAVATGAKFSSLTTGAVLFLKAQTFRETVASTSSGATVFRNVVDDGSNADTSSINETGNHIIRGKDKVLLGTSVADVVEFYGVGAKWLTNPHFIAYNNAAQIDITGDATLADVIMTQVAANIGSHYNIGTGVFTAPTTGLYFFNLILFLKDFNASHNDVNIRLLTTLANWYLKQGNPLYLKSGLSGDLILNGSIEVFLNSGNTAKFQTQASGSTKIVDVEIGSTCSGRLISKA